jgi:acetylornithine aminotransferase
VALSPVLAEQSTYPFVRLEQAKREAAARGVDIIDFGQGDPREPTDPLIRRALADGVAVTMGYPKAEGLPELRAAIAGWVTRRFGVDLDPDRELIPTLGSKEAIFSFAQVFADVQSGKDTVLVPDPAYPVYERGAEFAGARIVRLPLLEEHGFLPDLTEVDEETLARTALVWVNYPNNPTAASAPRGFFAELAELAARYDFLVCSDEAYSELWFDEPPASALELADRSKVVVFNTLSKRSSMTGYRSAFVAGAPWVIDALRKYRPTVGTAPQEFVQRASIVAWGDETHVESARAVYRRKRDVLLPAFERLGWRAAGKDATMYLWFALPDGETSEAAAERLLEHGIVVAPGAYLGQAGEGYARVALVPTVEDCERAATVLRRLA